MDKQHFVDLLNSHQADLRSLGITRIGLFGSVLRNETTSESDVDVLLDFAPQKKTYRNFYKTTELLEQLFKRKIDAVTPQSLSPYIKPYIEHNIYYVQIN